MPRSSLPALSLVHHFASLTDPRLRRRRRHQLLDIIAIAICAVVCGCKSWREVAVYGRKKAGWLRTFLELPGGIPSKDTFRRVFARIKPSAFQGLRPADRVIDGCGLILPKGGHNHGPWPSAGRAEGTSVATLDR